MFKRFSVSIVCLLVGISTALAQQTAGPALMPIPRKFATGNGMLPVGADFSIAVKTTSADSLLLRAVNRMQLALARKTGINFHQQRVGIHDKSDTATLLLQTELSKIPDIGCNESYTLSITAGHIVLKAPETAGALHGLQTLLQLLQKQNGEYFFPAIEISDKPRFAWRGLMIDVARHFIPLDVLQRNIEAMAIVKMNVLHLHLSDNEGFRIESKIFPQLQGSGSFGEYYTQAQIRDLVAFARDRGITIIPEFDMPGHSKSWFAGYPQLASAAGPYEPGPALDMPAGKPLNLGEIMKLVNTASFPTMDPSRESTYTFIDRFFGEMTALFPSRYIHIGADENNGMAWKNNPAIVSFMEQHKITDVHALQAYFVERVRKIVSAHHKTMIGWEELFSEHLSKEVVVQVWQNGNYVGRSLANGNPTLVSKGFYLDVFMPAYIHYNNADIRKLAGDGSGTSLLGGEAAQWTEMADKNNIETRIWPRAAAVAERLWSPATVNDPDDMYRRLDIVSAALDEAGLLHISNYEKALRMYTGGGDIAALKTFTDLLTPVKGYKKLFARLTSPTGALHQTSPLTEVSDIVFVDSDIKWKFRAAVNTYLKNKDAESEKIILDYLNSWRSNDDKIQTLLDTRRELAAVKEHARHLTAMAGIGLEALEYLKKGTQPPAEWVTEKINLLKGFDHPIAETELSVIPEIGSLVTQQPAALPGEFPMF